MIKFLIEEQRLTKRCVAGVSSRWQQAQPLHIACPMVHRCSSAPLMLTAVDITKRTLCNWHCIEGTRLPNFVRQLQRSVGGFMDSTGHAALHTAASLGALDIVRKLVRHTMQQRICAVVTVKRSFHQRTSATLTSADKLRQRRAAALRYRKPRRYQPRVTTTLCVPHRHIRGHTALWCAATGGARCGAVVATCPASFGENESLDNVLGSDFSR